MRGKGGLSGARQGVSQGRLDDHRRALILAALGVLPDNDSFVSKYRLSEYRKSLSQTADNTELLGIIHDRLDGWRYYRVSDAKREALEKRLTSLQRRARRIDAHPIDFDWSNEQDFVIREDESGNQTEHAFSFMRLRGEKPQIEGYTFLAALEHLDEGNLVKALPSSEEVVDFSPWYKTGALCEHCNLNRHRKGTYLVRHPKTGEIKQIGRACLKDYLGGHDPDRLLRAAEFERNVEEELERGDYAEFGAGENVVANDNYLALVAALSREVGWLSRGAAYDKGGIATSDLALRMLRDGSWDGNTVSVQMGYTGERLTVNVQEEDTQKAFAAVDWARNLDDDQIAETPYLHNLKVATSRELSAHKNLGLVASVIVAYDKAHQKAQDAALSAHRKNEHVGAKGDKLKDVSVTLKFVRAFDNQYGTRYLHNFEDSEGRTFTWWTGKNIWAEGEKFDLSGTVKDHDDYQGTKQTVMTRCKLQEAT